MTTEEMVYSFQQLLIDTSPVFHDKERLDTYEILDYLNRTIDRYIKMKYFSSGSFKATTALLSASVDDLGDLVLMSPETTTFVAVANMTGVYSSALPSDFMGYIRSDSQITRTTVLICASQWVPNKEIDYNDIDDVIITPYNKPILEAPLVTLQGFSGVINKGRFLTIVDSFTAKPESNVITYMKTPETITMSTQDCELAAHLHEEIVKLAVSMYLDEYKLRLQQTTKSR